MRSECLASIAINIIMCRYNSGDSATAGQYGWTFIRKNSFTVVNRSTLNISHTEYEGCRIPHKFNYCQWTRRKIDCIAVVECSYDRDRKKYLKIHPDMNTIYQAVQVFGTIEQMKVSFLLHLISSLCEITATSLYWRAKSPLYQDIHTSK